MKGYAGACAQLCKIGEWQGLWNTLTVREREVARLVAIGRRNKEIASDLCLSQLTVETHLKHIYDKLEIRSRTELANVIYNLTTYESYVRVAP